MSPAPDFHRDRYTALSEPLPSLLYRGGQLRPPDPFPRFPGAVLCVRGFPRRILLPGEVPRRYVGGIEPPVWRGLVHPLRVVRGLGPPFRVAESRLP